MTEKQRKDDLKEAIKIKIALMIGTKELTLKSITPAYFKNIKSWLSSKEYTLEEYMFCLNYISSQYYSWEVELKDINSIDNCGRLIYLVNENIDICKDLLSKHISMIENDDGIKLTSATNVKDYNEIAEKVGL